MVDDGDGVFGAYSLAAVYHTSAAGRRYIDAIDWAFIARAVNHFDDIGIVLMATHRHQDTVLDDCAFLVDAAARLCFRAGTEQGRYLHIGILQPAFIGTPDHLYQNFVLTILNVGIKYSVGIHDQ